MALAQKARTDGGEIMEVEEAVYGEDVVFWNIDTQYDFMMPDGKLPVGQGQGAEDIIPALEEITQIARDNGIRVVNTADYHNEQSDEFSEEPDFDETYPPHCIGETPGARYIEATQPKNALEIDWRKTPNWEDVAEHTGDFVVYKDAFDVFAGQPESPYAEDLVDMLQPDQAVVYGVATEVCVDYAVEGLLERGIEVYVPKDAIKGINPVDAEKAVKRWREKGVEIGTISDVESYLGL